MSIFCKKLFQTTKMRRSGWRTGVVNFFFAWVRSFQRGPINVLIKPNCVLSAEALELDSNGRFIILRLKTGENALYVINVYAPTDKREQIDFIDFLSKKVISLTGTSNLVITGDIGIR